MILSLIIAIGLIWAAYRIGYYYGIEYAKTEFIKIINEAQEEIDK